MNSTAEAFKKYLTETAALLASELSEITRYLLYSGLSVDEEGMAVIDIELRISHLQRRLEFPFDLTHHQIQFLESEIAFLEAMKASRPIAPTHPTNYTKQ